MSELEIYDKFEELRASMDCISKDLQNREVQNNFINNLADIIKYTIENNNKVLSIQILEFMTDTFLALGKLDYDSIEDVLDSLTASRIIIKKLINEV